jgi:ABC-type phosphate/phosphonate transport system substrate-binding protein
VIQGGLGCGAEAFFGGIKRARKVSAAVLPVFFGQEVMAVVAESGFKTMSELNPQLRRKLRTIAKSPPLIPAILCFREDFSSEEKERLLQALRQLHTTAAGEQVLTIFQSEALVEVDEGALRKTLAFLQETSQLRGENGCAPADRPKVEGGSSHE